MAQQMRDVHPQRDPETTVQDRNYEQALKNLHSACTDRKAVNAVDEAVSALQVVIEETEYKNGFSDAICMILQACMHGK